MRYAKWSCSYSPFEIDIIYYSPLEINYRLRRCFIFYSSFVLSCVVFAYHPWRLYGGIDSSCAFGTLGDRLSSFRVSLLLFLSLVVWIRYYLYLLSFLFAFCFLRRPVVFWLQCLFLLVFIINFYLYVNFFTSIEVLVVQSCWTRCMFLVLLDLLHVSCLVKCFDVTVVVLCYLFWFVVTWGACYCRCRSCIC